MREREQDNMREREQDNMRERERRQQEGERAKTSDGVSVVGVQRSLDMTQSFQLLC